MKVLALETSTKMASIALTNDDSLIAEYQILLGRSYSEMLLPAIEYLLQNSDTSVHDIDAFALAQGPGSFTSLRIGMSVVKGLSMGVKVPVVPIPSLDGLAHNVCYASHLVCPLIDARKGEVYAAFYKKTDSSQLTKIRSDRSLRPEHLLDEISEDVVFLGDGSNLYRELIVERLKGKAHFAPLHLMYPRASVIAQLAFQKIENNSMVPERALLTPLYIRFPEAEIKMGKSR